MSLYRTVPTEGQRADVVASLDRDLLLAQWSVLRTLVSKRIRVVREKAFSELVDRASVPE
ncbi:hypothetical protein [Streptomyces sp. NPDC002205]|uniref:hypothetical protein n=1 Tax=Streptomyces sp. NPDC002205 TaxID=3154411 RepID=UPI00332E42BD